MEKAQKIYEWVESRQSIDLESVYPVPLPVKARVLLLEGLTEEVKDACCLRLGIPKEFFICHESESVRMQRVINTNNKHCVSVKWSRLVSQSARQRDIGLRILKGIPYDIETSRDPHRLRLDHERYDQLSGIFRPYFPISQTLEGGWRHAARENISLCWEDRDACLFG